MTNKWLDPAEFKTNEEFIKAYNEVHARAKAFAEVIQKIDGAKDRIADIEVRMKTIGKNYAI